jgi:hypothetical protein
METQFTRQRGRFAILTHDHPFFHWDLLLEAGNAAWTWRLRERRETRDEGREPAIPPSDLSTLFIERIADHRRLYLDYEGPVSGNRGHVARVDWGEYSITSECEAEFHVWLVGQQDSRTIILPRESAERPG